MSYDARGSERHTDDLPPNYIEYYRYHLQNIILHVYSERKLVSSRPTMGRVKKPKPAIIRR